MGFSQALKFYSLVELISPSDQFPFGILLKKIYFGEILDPQSSGNTV